MTTPTVKSVLSQGDQNRLGALAQLSKLGLGLAAMSRTARGAVASDTLVLPEEAKALGVLAAYATVAGTQGPLTPVLGGAPATTEVSTTPGGDIVFAGADAVTEAVVIYLPHEGQIFEDVVDVDAAGAALFRGDRQSMQVISAVLGDGAAVPGTKTQVARGGTPATGEVALTHEGTGLAFLAADVGAGGATATVKYVALPGVGSGVFASFGDRLDAVYPLT